MAETSVISIYCNTSSPSQSGSNKNSIEVQVKLNGQRQQEREDRCYTASKHSCAAEREKWAISQLVLVEMIMEKKE